MNWPHNSRTILLASLVLLTLVVQHYHRGSRTHTENPQNLPILLVGTNSEYPPFTSINEQDEIVGFDIDIIKEVARRMGRHVVLEDMAFDALLPKLQRGAIQVIAAGMSPTPERAKKVLFTVPYFSGDPLIVITRATEQPLQSLADLTGKEVVVNEGFTAYDYFMNIKGPVLTLLPAPIDGFLAVEKKLTYAFATARSSARPFFKRYNINNFNVFEIQDAHEHTALAVCPQCPELLKEIQQQLDAMAADGTLETIKKKWNLV